MADMPQLIMSSSAPSKSSLSAGPIHCPVAASRGSILILVGQGAMGLGHQINALWMLDDLTPENGPTRVVPGSHRWPEFPQDQMDDLMAPHPDEVYITGPAGSVGFFNGQIWHGRTVNRSERTRRVYHCALAARENAQQTDQKEYLRPETEARLAPAARYILDV